MKKQIIPFVLCLALTLDNAFAQWNNSGDNQTTGNLTVGGSLNAGLFYMVSPYGGTNFSIQKPTATGMPFTITLGNANIEGGIMIGRTDWLSKVLIPWRLGIVTTTPQTNLDVATGVNSFVSFGDQLGLSSNNNYSGIHFGYLEYNNSLYRKSALVFERLDGSARGKIHILNNGGANSSSASLADSKLTIDYTGNVGLGNSSPADKLQLGVEGFMNMKVGRWASFGETGSAYATIIGNNVRASTSSNAKMEYITTTADGAKAIKMQYNEGISFHTYQGSVTAGQAFTGYERMRIDNSGNVGIGTSSPDAKLSVNGTIHTKEVKVDLTGWPDYVFEDSYNLPSLQELSTYIKQNKHLPEVPAADDVERNGVNLGEMNKLLLKKVEELTLYVIQQQKEIENLKKKINQNDDKE